MQTILITGGTGLVGRALTTALVQKGYKVIILTRHIPDKQPGDNTSYALWDVNKQTIDISAIEAADHIIHLAGAGVVEKKWTAAYKKEIIDSRVKSSQLLISALEGHSNVVKTVISASAIGWYGADSGQTRFIETDSPKKDFLGETCRLWEESVDPVTLLGKRLIKLRVGIVLSNEGGALAEFKRPIRFGVAAILSNGKQMVSWIHIDDLCRMFIHAIENDNISGAYNAVAPVPVSNKMLTLSLAKAIRGKFFIPLHIPAFLLKLMLGQRSIEVLKSATVSCEKIKKSGFVFLYPSIETAIEELNKKAKRYHQVFRSVLRK